MFEIVALRIANMALRGLAMGSKFVLMVVLAKYIEPEEIGIYGLLMATISFGVLCIGGDFYTYSHRELLSMPRNLWSFVVQHQTIAVSLIYIIAIPFHLLLFKFNLLPSNYIIWFFCLLIAEHIAQEINRLLIVMQHQILASLVMFIRMGAWVWVLLPIMWLCPTLRSLNSVFLAWLSGAILAILLGVFIIYTSVGSWRWWPLDRTWLMQGYKISFFFLIASMCFRVLQTLDRYLVNFLVGPELLGVYVLFMGFAMAGFNFIDPAIFSFLYPPLVTAYRKKETKTFQNILKEMMVSAIGLSTALALIIALLAPFVLHWIGRQVYIMHLPVLWILLIMTVLYAAGMVPHYGLYAIGADKIIVLAHVTSIPIFAVVSFLLAPHKPLTAICYGLVGAFAWMGCFKAWGFILKTHFRGTFDF